MTYTEQEFDDFLAGYIECGLWADLYGICPYCKQKARDAGDGDNMICDDADCQRRHGHDGKVTAESGAGNEWPEWVDELADETTEKLRAECADFLSAQLADLREYCERIDARDTGDGSNPTPMAWAGHDFWLTRGGHGAGFWDRGLGKLGDRLTEACKSYRETYIYVGDDGKVWT